MTFNDITKNILWLDTCLLLLVWLLIENEFRLSEYTYISDVPILFMYHSSIE